jgi:hypothetical protein
MGRKPKWECDTVIELSVPVATDEMSQRLDEVAGVLIECLRQLRSPKSIPHEVLVSDLLRDFSRDRTGTDG